MRRLALIIAMATLCSCTMVRTTRTTTTVTVIGAGSVERCQPAPQCGGEVETLECLTIKGDGISAGLAGAIETMLAGVAAYFTGVF